MSKFKNLSANKKNEVLNELENILIEYGFLKVCKDPNHKKRYSIDNLPHKSYIQGLQMGWNYDYPKLSIIMDYHDLYDLFELDVEE